MNEKKIVQLLEPEIAKKHNIRLAYVLVECECGRTFGVSPNELNQVAEDKLICFSCFTRKYESLINKELSK